MKNIINLFLVLLCGFGLLCACDNWEERKAPDICTGKILPCMLRYTIQVVNKTNRPVTVSNSMGLFQKYDAENKAEILDWDLRTPEHKIGANSEKICRDFEWGAHGRYDKDSFKPYTYSFYLRLNIDGSDYYLAGWPSQYTSLIQGWSVPANKIVQTGLGWAENKVPRTKNGETYLPFIIKHQGGTKDFDDASVVYAKATLTINSKAGKPDITFVTTSLQLTE